MSMLFITTIGHRAKMSDRVCVMNRVKIVEHGNDEASSRTRLTLIPGIFSMPSPPVRPVASPQRNQDHEGRRTCG